MMDNETAQEVQDNDYVSIYWWIFEGVLAISNGSIIQQNEIHYWIHGNIIIEGANWGANHGQVVIPKDCVFDISKIH